MKKIIVSITLALLIVSLYGCSNKVNSNYNRLKIVDNFISDNNLQPQDDVFAFQFRGWSSLDDRHLIIDSGLNKEYLVQLEGYCTDLSHAVNIRINQTVSNRLQKHFDSISVLGQNFPQNCRIGEVYLLNDELKNKLNAVYEKNK